MQNNHVFNELVSLNSNMEDLACTDENMWFSRKPEYAGFIAELKENIQNHDVRGTILVATDREIIFASGSRSVDISGRTVTPLTTFEIGSLTKMYTAVLIFKLIEEGKLAPGDRITKLFPEYTRAGTVTVFDLLHMRSGIVDFANDCDVFFGDDPSLVEAFDNGEITDEVFLQHLYKLDLTFEPGSKMEYCNTNYVLLAMIIEKLTGKSYKENVQEKIFDPLDMNASSAETWGDVTSVPEGKYGYMKEYHTARGAGDIHSNALDLLKFDRAFFNERIVSPAAKAGILNFIDNYGCGWELSSKYSDMVLHDGDTNSYSALNVAFHASESRTYFIMLSCCSGVEDDGEESEADGAGEADQEAERKEKFNQYQLIFGLCRKYLQ